MNASSGPDPCDVCLAQKQEIGRECWPHGPPAVGPRGRVWLSLPSAGCPLPSEADTLLTLAL